MLLKSSKISLFLRILNFQVIFLKNLFHNIIIFLCFNLKWVFKCPQQNAEILQKKILGVRYKGKRDKRGREREREGEGERGREREGER